MIIMIPPVLQELHWLPEGQRIDFKILLVTFKPINGIAPPYAPINAKPKGHHHHRHRRRHHHHHIDIDRCIS